MACNKCGHTKSSPCSCKDTPLETTGPGLYADCNQVVDTGRGTMTIPERCDEIVCRECVARCNDCCPAMTSKEMIAQGISGGGAGEGYDGDLWQVETKGTPFKSLCGERLDMTIQRLALAMNDETQIQWQIPLFYIVQKTHLDNGLWTVTLGWEGGDWSSMIGVQVYFQCLSCDDNSWVLHNAPGTPYPTPSTLASGNPIYYNISNLQDGYRYAFKLVVEHAGDAGTFTDPATVVQKAIMFDCE